MTTKILCPINFSIASNNAIEYASKFAQTINAKLTLFNVQHINMSEGVSLFSFEERQSVHDAKVSADRMQDYCTSIKNLFGIEVDFEILPTMVAFEKIIADQSTRFDLIIIGTNGADDLFQFYFGSHSFKVATNATVPVLIIPEQCAFSPLSTITFVSDYIYGDELLLKQLKDFLNDFKLRLQVIHISQKDTPESAEVFQTFCNCISEVFKEVANSISFERIINTDETDAINNITSNVETDLIAMSFKKHGFLYNLFHKDIVRQLSTTENYPALIFNA